MVLGDHRVSQDSLERVCLGGCLEVIALISLLSEMRAGQRADAGTCSLDSCGATPSAGAEDSATAPN